MNKKEKILFFLIFTFAAFLRLWHLGQAPPGLYSDEVDVAYQARLFLDQKTDYFGNSWPIHFHSFADWRTPGYIYSALPFIALADPSATAVRLPAALWGLLSLLAFFHLCKKIFKQTGPALLALALLSFSPWHIHYSRIAFEVTGMLFFILLGLSFLLSFLKKPKPHLFLISFSSFILSTYFYSTAKLFVPIIVISALFFWWPVFKKTLLSRRFLPSFLLLFLLALPMIRSLAAGEAGFRFSYINIFTDPTTPQEIDRLRETDAVILNQGQKEVGMSTPLSSKIFHNKLLFWGQTGLKNYLQAFSTQFLFISGDQNPRHGFLKTGMLYPLEFFIIILSLIFFVPSKEKTFFLTLLFLTPLPFALTRDEPGAHATRLFLLLPFLYLLEANGLALIYQKLKRLPRIIIFSSLATAYLLSFILFWHHYLYHYPGLSERYWNAATQEVVQKAFASQEKFDHIYFSQSSHQSLLPFFLFWNNYHETLSQINLQPASDSFIDGEYFDKFYFGQLNLGSAYNNPTNFFKKENLYLLESADLPPKLLEDHSLSFTIIDQINYPASALPAYYLVTGL